MVEVVDIYKTYNKNDVLKGINLSIRDGEIICILGRSGAGKSTLLNIIGSLLIPTKGKILIDNDDIYALNDKKLSEIRNRNIGFIFQTPQLIEELNVAQNILLPYWISGKKSTSTEEKVLTLLEEFEISHLKNEKIRNLSGGEKQRIAIIRAMIMKPKIIIADEPTGNLDEKNKIYLKECLKKMNEKYNLTILIATHDREMAKITDKIIEIKDGKIYHV